jgi:Transposase domain (DUF772)
MRLSAILEGAVAHRLIGRERLGIASEARASSSLDGLAGILDWNEIVGLLAGIHVNSKGEAAWPPLAMFKALLLAVWYDLSDVKLAEALDDRASFRRFCGFTGSEATLERKAFVRFCNALIAQGLEPAHPPGARPDREDLWNMETKLWPAPDAMARDCKSRLPNPPHCIRLAIIGCIETA